MLSLMMDVPLLISSIVDYAADAHGDTEIVSRTMEGGVFRYTYRAARARSKRLANALTRLGIDHGDRVGSLAWSTHQHLELFYGVSGRGAVLNTINPRLFREQLIYIINHAEDRILFIDAETMALAESLAPHLPTVQRYVYMAAGTEVPKSGRLELISYEALLAAESADYEWPEFDERSASTLCYTSGTTGNPKGVLYSHRSAALTGLSYGAADTFGGYRQGMLDVIMPLTPMYHGNAWQIPYTAPINGFKIVLPGRNFEPEKLYELIEAEGVTLTAGVPTVWERVIGYLESSGKTFSTLRASLLSGSSPSRALVEKLERVYGVRVSQIWAMTEAPACLKGSLRPGTEGASPDEQLDQKLKHGRFNFGAQFRIVDESGRRLPHDGVAIGRLLVRAPWVAKNYFRHDEDGKVDFDWLDTGDVARIQADGHVEITDRAKDVIKSGGEWISSLELENAASDFPGVSRVAVIGVAHAKWGERPLMLAVLHPGITGDVEGLRKHLSLKVASWWLPDNILFVDEIPLTAVGKLNKLKLREIYRDYPPG